MRLDVLTLFPTIFESFLGESLISKALDKGTFEVHLVDIRDFTEDRHRTVDDRPFGGGPGMVLRPEPLARAIAASRENAPRETGARVVILTPAGRRLDQAKVLEYAGLEHLVLVCGRYEGVDERVARTLVDEEISVGDYVLSGGEVPAMIVIEAVTRLLPGVMGKAESAQEETFAGGLIEYPQYTRPRRFMDLEVPEVLISGDHEAVRVWRRRQSLRRTLDRRPDLLDKARLTPEDRELLAGIRAETAINDPTDKKG
ncbi:MAG: tRNA (guanosine(37)-N1)-methyltransferase TrmD [Proteobacteria bacterium]|nr:tRNA (guanosine(37)-N1)-methyltransferase TrmD [Pseudomonadota bacterium]